VRALVVLASPPLPEGGAPGRCALGLIRGLLAHGVDVRVLAARQHFAGEVPDDIPIELVDVRSPANGIRTIPGRVRRPRGHLADYLGSRVRELAKSADVIHLEQAETAWCDEDAPTPSLVHLHYRIRRDRDLGPPWRSEFRFVLEHALAERSAIRRHRYLLASSPLIAEQLRREAPRAHVVQAPLTLDPSYYDPASLEAPIAGVIGTAEWLPTARGIRRLVRQIWPEVLHQSPQATLRIAGRGTDGLLAGEARPGIEVLGEVPSSAAFLKGLSLLIYPLERGSGMKVKVLEAIACGLPVVTTPAGAEGLDAGDGIIVEQSDSALAHTSSRLLLDADERRERGAAARRSFLEHYSPKPATEPIVGLYAQMAEDR
jgi:glycosyltransferase involved in cell wall biosynthesis